jgi:hypothetical protein
MELADLNDDERMALVGLTKLIVLSDGEVADDELEHVEALVSAFGEDGYQDALDRFEDEFADEPAFRKFLEQKVQRQDARDLIFGTILSSAEEGALDGKETRLLDWLSGTWNVKIEIADGAL